MAMAKRTTSAAPRHRTPSIEVVQAVVDAAVRIIGTDGAEGVTVRRLATEAGVAPMSIYNHFGDMHGVFDAVFEQGFTEFTQTLHRSSVSLDPVVALRDMGNAYRRFALDNPDTYAVMFLRVVPGFEPSEEAFVAAAQSFEELSTVVRRALQTKQLRDGDPSVIAQEIWATCHGAVALELLGISEFADPDETYAALMLTLLRGLLLNPTESEGLA